MNHDIRNLTAFDKDLLLAWFLHYMPTGQQPVECKATRELFMREYPAMYNRLYAGTIVKAVRADGSEI